MTPARRWAVVALGLLLVVAVPVALRVRPTPDNDISASALLARVRASQDAAYAGFVVTQGTLQLPVASRFTDLGTLFGEQNRLRVWWRGADAWRVDRLLTAGEEDLIHDGEQTTSYDYDDAQANTSIDPDVRLPRTADLLPPDLARRLLIDATDAEVSRLDTRRIAGRAAPGLRLEPASTQTSIDRVDLWADPETGIPLRVEVFGASGRAGLTSAFRSFTPDRPSIDRVSFSPTADTDASFDDVLDIADAANQYAPLRPPDSVAGLARSKSGDDGDAGDDGEDGAVGVYGSGATQLIAIPLRGREAEPLRNQIGLTPGVLTSPAGTLVAVGPLGLLLTGEGDDGGWLVTGTVTGDTLVAAAADLAAGTVFVEDHR